MAAVLQQPGICPVVGTKNLVLPPTHPVFDSHKPGQKCPVTKATTDAHLKLEWESHPGLPNYAAGSDPMDAAQCPALKKIVSQPDEVAMDEKVCPVVGAVSSVLPPSHPSIEGLSEKETCPKTNASLGSHKNKVLHHPPVQGAEKGAVCPVVGNIGEKK